MTYDHAGKLVLRLAVGGLMLPHGLHKLMHGVDGIAALLAVKGLPTWLAYGALLGEVAAPLLLLLGLYSRAAGLIVVLHMLVALWLAHMGHLHQFTSGGGWRLELQAFFLMGAAAIALMGADRFSLGGSGGRYN